jgi:hypothetical protein
MPCWVMLDSFVARAMPKSMSFTVPSSSTMTFPGFRSRWIRPLLWTSARAEVIARAIRRHSS